MARARAPAVFFKARPSASIPEGQCPGKPWALFSELDYLGQRDALFRRVACDLTSAFETTE
jgi:hypothetical protein